MAKQKMLLVEDQIEITDLMMQYLGNFEVVIAENYKQAWDALASNRFDIIITDFNFPGGNGNDVAELARKISRAIIILHTSDVDSENIQHELYSQVHSKLNREFLNALKKAA